MSSRPEVAQRIELLIRELDREQGLLAAQIGRRSADAEKGLLVRQALLDDALRWLYVARLEAGDTEAEAHLRKALELMAQALGDGRP